MTNPRSDGRDDGPDGFRWLAPGFTVQGAGEDRSYTGRIDGRGSELRFLVREAGGPRARVRLSRAEGHRFERSAEVAAALRGDVLFAHHLEGRVEGEFDGQAMRAEPGESYLLDAAAPGAVDVEDGTTMLLAIFPRPADAPALERPVIRLPPSAFLEAGLGFLRGAVLHALSPRDPSSARIEQGLLAVRDGLLIPDVLQPPGRREADPEEILRYIDAHVTDPRLGVASIAAAFGVSVRTVHLRFASPDDLGPAAHIRRRRVELAAELLRTAPARWTGVELARRVGFSSGDRLRRAFVEVLGVTPHGYAERLRG